MAKKGSKAVMIAQIESGRTLAKEKTWENKKLKEKNLELEAKIINELDKEFKRRFGNQK